MSGGFFWRVLNNCEMTQSFEIPDGISFDALKEHMESAVSEEELQLPQKSDTQKFFETSNLTDRAIKILNESADGLDGQQASLLHKMMLHLIAERMLEFHSRVGLMQIEEGENLSAISWLRDAGKFQSVLNILSTISCGDDDPTCANA